MRHINLHSFTQAVQQLSSPLPPIYFLIGKEESERKEAESLLIKKLLGNQKREEALHIFDANETRISSILDTLTSKSFFADKTIVCLRNADAFNKEALSQLEAYLEAPAPFSLLILSAASIHRGSKLYKKAEKTALMLDIEEEKAWEKERALTKTVSDWVLLFEKKIDINTAKFLVEYCGADRSLLKAELEKLICYIGDRPSITAEDIRAICTKGENGDGWKLGDAIFQKNGTLALRIGQALIQEGSAIFAVLRQLRSQFQTKLQLSAFLANGGGTAEIQQKFPYMRGQILQQNIQIATNYGAAALKKGILEIDAAELQAKNSSEEPRQILQQLLIKLTNTAYENSHIL